MYNNYYGQQPYYNQQQYYTQQQSITPQQSTQQPNMNFIPLYFVSSEEDVKKYIVMPNQMAYFKDINSNTLYEKKADNFSNYSTKKYELIDTSAPLPKFATIEDLNALRVEVQQALGGLRNEQ